MCQVKDARQKCPRGAGLEQMQRLERLLQRPRTWVGTSVATSWTTEGLGLTLQETSYTVLTGVEL